MKKGILCFTFSFFGYILYAQHVTVVSLFALEKEKVTRIPTKFVGMITPTVGYSINNSVGCGVEAVAVINKTKKSFPGIFAFGWQWYPSTKNHEFSATWLITGTGKKDLFLTPFVGIEWERNVAFTGGVNFTLFRGGVSSKKDMKLKGWLPLVALSSDIGFGL